MIFKYVLLITLFITLSWSANGQSSKEASKQLREKFGEIEEYSFHVGKDSAFYAMFDDLFQMLVVYKKKHGFDSDYNDLSMAYARVMSEKDPLVALEIIESNIENALATENKDALNRNYHEMAVFYQRFGDIEKAAEYFLKSNAMFKKQKDWQAYGYSLIDLGNFYYSIKKFDMARYYYNNAEFVFERNLKGNDLIYAQALVQNNLGLVFMEKKQADSALMCFRNALAIRMKNPANESYYSLSYLYFILAFKELNQEDSIRYYFEKAIQSQRQFKIHDELISSLISYAVYLNSRSKFKEAMDVFGEVSDLLKRYKFDIHYPRYYYNLGHLYHEKTNFDTALYYYLKADSVAQLYHQKDFIKNTNIALIDIYKDLGNYKAAINIYDKYIKNLRDEVHFENSRRDIQIQLKDRKMEDEINREVAEQNHRVIFAQALILVLLVVILVLSVVMGLRFRKQKIEIQKTIQYRDIILSIIGHDLRGPLGSVYSTLELIEMGEVEDVETQQRIIRTANQSLRSAYYLLENLLDWANFQGQRKQIAPEKLALAEIVDNIVLLLGELAKRKSIDIQVQIDPSYSIFADRNMMTAVFRNLLSNAIKFSHPDSTIEVKAEKQNKNIKISFIDHGVGMSKDALKTLQSGEKLQSTLGTKKEKGSGLGLMIITEFVKINKGHFEVESEVGKGTTFTLLLPNAGN